MSIYYSNQINSLDVVCFSEKRLHAVEANKIIKECKETGLSDSSTLDTHLSKSNYIPVLKAIWSERDKEKRLTWLRDKSSELHAPLLFEQAIAEFVASPLAETVNKVSFPLIKLASFRVMQDSKCSKDASICGYSDSSFGDAGKYMEMTYREALQIQIKKYLNTSLDKVFQSETALSIVHSKLKEIDLKSDSQKLPIPDWIGHHGTDAFSGSVKMHPTDEHSKIRNAVTKTFLKLFN